MTDFASTQTQLAGARGAYDAAALAASKANAQAQQAQAALDTATRQVNQNGDNQQSLAQLKAAAENAAANKVAAQAALGNARASLNDAAGQFANFSDPRRSLSLLSDATPFLLFPVRIETRFRTNAPSAGAAATHELLVRIYPDDCSIDTFEPFPSQSELTNVKNYWMNFWRAGGIENDQRGAWANLVSAHGSGRAGWLADNFQPVNLADVPVKVAASDEILVIPTTNPLAVADAAAISAYWRSLWIANGDVSKINGAQATLVATVGAAQATNLTTNYVPFNLNDTPAAPLAKDGVAVSVAFVVFHPDPTTTLQSWSQAPQVRQFPDRFIVLGFDGNMNQTLEAMGSAVTLPLFTGPDPTADPKTDPTSCIHPEGAELFIPDELQWMVNFDRAVAAGMGIAIQLTPEQAAAGFHRLLVVGLQLSKTGSDGAAALQELLSHHQVGRSGFFIVPQGTPAHNSTGTNAGSTPEDDPDASFDDRKGLPLFTPVSDPTQKRDGQWLAEFLGLDPSFVATVHASGGVDQMQARAMQTALWPATLGYWMQTLFTPRPATVSIFSDEVIEETREFFCSFVSGRGPLPAIRIGGQPYGILPTTAFSRIQWYQPQQVLRLAPTIAFQNALYTLLQKIGSDWQAFAQNVSWVGKSGDPHQILLDVLALHPSSVEYFSRNSESLSQLQNMMNLFALGPFWSSSLAKIDFEAPAVALLRRLGYTESQLPDLLNHFFLTDNPQITTIIDDRPLSETVGIRAYTDDGRNYIQWLVDAASTSLDALREESGFTNNQTPQALLYLCIRHALLLGYYSSSYNLHRTAGSLSATELLSMRIEPTFVHVAESAATSESRYAALYKTESRITGSPSLLVSDYIRAQIGAATPEVADLTAQLAALKILANPNTTTAELERLFAEHIDTCSYRYDSWLLGLVNQHIINQRASIAAGQQRPGLYLGAYAWVEDLSPTTDVLTPVQLPMSLASQFPGDPPLMTDNKNGGYIHAPSIPHANAAAVLRSGFVAAQNSGGDPGQLSVNLSSDRVRVALALIEGIRNGQSLGALLGYQFEVGLHDSYGLDEVDKFIYPLRKAFPLVADSMSSTATPADAPIEAIEARNVVDGKKLLDQTAASGNTAYPFGLTTLPSATADEAKAINAQVNALQDAYDAVADLALAEGVYQAVQGNYDRVASTIAAYTTGNFPPEPGVVETAPPGIGLTHRFAIQLRPGLPAPAGATPRATAEPAVDDWLSNMLPSLNQIGCSVSWTDPVTAAAQEQLVTLADLGLRPLDCLYLIKPDNLQQMAELDDRIQRYVVATRNPRPDATIAIQYMAAPGAKFVLFECGPLLRSLRTLVTQSRPLKASDPRRANDASQQDNSSIFVDSTRITTPLADLTTLATDINNFLQLTLAPLLADTVANRATILANVDSYMSSGISLLERASRFALPSSGWGFAYAWLHGAFSDMYSQVGALISRWKHKLVDFNAALAAYDALPAATSDADRFVALQSAELIVSSSLDPLPATPALLRASLPAKGTALQARLAQFETIQSSGGSSFSSLYASITALSTGQFDSRPFSISSDGDSAILFTEDLSRTLTSQLASANTKIAGVNAQLTIATSAASPTDQVAALSAAAKALFGDDFQIIPEFTVSAAQGGEWANAVSSSNTGEIFNYLKTKLKIDFPIDEWFYGVARVRPAVKAWESAIMLTTAFDITPPSMTPIQLPYAANDSWLALPFPDTYTIDSDRLLYTCIYSEPFNPAAHQCGLLVDEWTEAIPATKRDTAVTFNYNRPDNEPPQTMLLVTSPGISGSWQWPDLVAALNETLDLAKKRSVEPALLDPTAYSRFLPAAVSASTSYAITIANILTASNGVIERLKGSANA